MLLSPLDFARDATRQILTYPAKSERGISPGGCARLCSKKLRKAHMINKLSMATAWACGCLGMEMKFCRVIGYEGLMVRRLGLRISFQKRCTANFCPPRKKFFDPSPRPFPPMPHPPYTTNPQPLTPPPICVSLFKRDERLAALTHFRVRGLRGRITKRNFAFFSLGEKAHLFHRQFSITFSSVHLF